MKLVLPLLALLALPVAGCQPDRSDPPTEVPSAPASEAAEEACADGIPCDAAEALATVGIPVVVPTDLPEGAEVVEVTVQPGGADMMTDGYAYYGLHYRAGDVCFTVEGTVAEGLGGAWPENETGPFEAARFVPTAGAEPSVVWWNGPDADPLDGVGPNVLWSDFVGLPQNPDVGYRLTSAAGAQSLGFADDPYEQADDCEMLDPEEARRIVSSLAVREERGG